jgi:hypothetical protein
MVPLLFSELRRNSPRAVPTQRWPLRSSVALRQINQLLCDGCCTCGNHVSRVVVDNAIDHCNHGRRGGDIDLLGVARGNDEGDADDDDERDDDNTRLDLYCSNLDLDQSFVSIL